MAKGQLRSNRETKKPKQSKQVTVPASGFIKPQQQTPAKLPSTQK